MTSERIRSLVRNVKDFPRKGIVFRDVTPVLLDPALCREATEAMARMVQDLMPDAVACVESRGFIFGFALAQRLALPFIPIRKVGKLPYKTISYKYDLEYGASEVEIHADAVQKRWKVLIHDDLLATGGTAAAAAELVRMQGGTVAGFVFLINLAFLNGAGILTPYSDKVFSVVNYSE